MARCTLTVILCAVVGCIAAAGACATTRSVTGSGPATVGVEDCGLGARLVRPKTLILACADANTQAVHLVWSRWTTTSATATGTYTWNTCVPYCAASKTWDDTAATFTLSKPVRTKKGLLFERLLVHITGRPPHGVSRTTTYSEAPVTS